MDNRERYYNPVKVAQFIREILELPDVFTFELLKEFIKSINGEIKYIFSYYSDSRIIKTKKGFVIEVAGIQPKERLLTSIAYSLGHVFVNLEYAINHEFWNKHTFDDLFNPNNNKKRSFYNNRAFDFTGEFIMPKEIFIEKVHEFTKEDMVDLKKLSHYFNVSVNAVEIRGKDLGVLAKD